METVEQELQKGISSGHRCLRQIEEIKGSLKSAVGLGYVDIFGGGFFTSMLKRSQINDVKNKLSQLNRSLEQFEAYVRDVYHFQRVQPLFGDFEMCLDVFFDNVLSDLNTQSKLNDLKCQLATVEEDVGKILDRLEAHH